MALIVQGNKAPAFSGLTDDGSTVSLNDFKGKKLQYLDRHDVDCGGTNMALTEFKPVGCGNKDQYKYSFTCRPVLP